MNQWLVNGCVVTGTSADLTPLRGHSIAIVDGCVAWVGPDNERPRLDLAQRDLNGALVTAGLIDCHTHLIYDDAQGRRISEFEQRLAGASYGEIARAGGGIRATQMATDRASVHALTQTAREHLSVLRARGVTALEVKASYAGDFAGVRKEVAALKTLKAGTDATLQAVWCAQIPFRSAASEAHYVDEVCQEVLPWLRDDATVEAVDVFCEEPPVGLSVAGSTRILQRAKDLGFAVKGHVDQLSNTHGAQMIASLEGLSADHIEYIDATGIAAMAQSKTVAVLLPGAFYCTRETQKPPIQALRDAGVAMAVATDMNPGSSPILDPLLCMHLACTLFGLRVDEAFLGMTANAARALGQQSLRGCITVGMSAELAIWRAQSVAELIYRVGDTQLVETIVAPTYGKAIKLPR